HVGQSHLRGHALGGARRSDAGELVAGAPRRGLREQDLEIRESMAGTVESVRETHFSQLPGIRPFGSEKQYFAISPARVYQTRSFCLCSTQCLTAWRTGRNR